MKKEKGFRRQKNFGYEGWVVLIAQSYDRNYG
jgi:hypothetical protein